MAVLEAMATDRDVTVTRFVRAVLAAAVRGGAEGAREATELAAV